MKTSADLISGLEIMLLTRIDINQSTDVNDLMSKWSSISIDNAAMSIR